MNRRCLPDINVNAAAVSQVDGLIPGSKMCPSVCVYLLGPQLKDTKDEPSLLPSPPM